MINSINIFSGFIFLLTFLPAFSQLPSHPFPNHTKYTSEHIKPGEYTQLQLDSYVTSFYERWKSKYIKDNCGNNQLYIEFSTNTNVSEGLGYGMMITAIMAGYDNEAKSLFDGLYNFYKAHPSTKNPYLMDWKQENCISIPGAEQSASDGDIDIAFSLLLADVQWGSNGAIDYLSAGRNIINAIMKDDINQNSWTVKLGDWVSPSESFYYYSTRSSDFIFDHFRSFKSATGDSRWDKVINKCYEIIDSIQSHYSPIAGLIPDFIINVNNNPEPAPENFLEGSYDGAYYYNACRDPWRIASDFLLSGENRAKNSVNKINNWLKKDSEEDPNLINPGYILSGEPIDTYDSPAFVGAFAVSAMVDSSHRDWLNKTFDFLNSIGFDNNDYYNNTLKMLYLIVLSGNYWTPESGTVNSVKNELSKIHIAVQQKVIIDGNLIFLKFPEYYGSYDLMMFNSLGENIITINDYGSQEITFDVSDYTPGLYLLKIINSEKNELLNYLILISN